MAKYSKKAGEKVEEVIHEMSIKISRQFIPTADEIFMVNNM